MAEATASLLFLGNGHANDIQRIHSPIPANFMVQDGQSLGYRGPRPSPVMMVSSQEFPPRVDTDKGVYKQKSNDRPPTYPNSDKKV